MNIFLQDIVNNHKFWFCNTIILDTWACMVVSLNHHIPQDAVNNHKFWFYNTIRNWGTCVNDVAY